MIRSRWSSGEVMSWWTHSRDLFVFRGNCFRVDGAGVWEAFRGLEMLSSPPQRSCYNPSNGGSPSKLYCAKTSHKGTYQRADSDSVAHLRCMCEGSKSLYSLYVSRWHHCHDSQATLEVALVGQEVLTSFLLSWVRFSYRAGTFF